MKIIELVKQNLALYKAELDIANRKLGLTSTIIAPNNSKHEVELNYLHILKFTAEGKVKAAQEILAALKELEQ